MGHLAVAVCLGEGAFRDRRGPGVCRGSRVRNGGRLRRQWLDTGSVNSYAFTGRGWQTYSLARSGEVSSQLLRSIKPTLPTPRAELPSACRPDAGCAKHLGYFGRIDRSAQRPGPRNTFTNDLQTGFDARELNRKLRAAASSIAKLDAYTLRILGLMEAPPCCNLRIVRGLVAI
jgi:hypothetical protein